MVETPLIAVGMEIVGKTKDEALQMIAEHYGKPLSELFPIVVKLHDSRVDGVRVGPGPVFAEKTYETMADFPADTDPVPDPPEGTEAYYVRYRKEDE